MVIAHDSGIVLCELQCETYSPLRDFVCVCTVFGSERFSLLRHCSRASYLATFVNCIYCMSMPSSLQIGEHLWKTQSVPSARFEPDGIDFEKCIHFPCTCDAINYFLYFVIYILMFTFVLPIHLWGMLSSLY
jgi:hypothetical protein